MRYVRLFADAEGRSHFEDSETNPETKHVVDGVPPLLLSGPFPVSEMTIAEQPKDAPSWEPHVAPRRQWLIVMSGRVAVSVSDGERREFEAGDLLLAEDTAGEGHLSVPLTDNFAFAMIPVA
jgi:quercetin dioxygenase-like cupin family protein